MLDTCICDIVDDDLVGNANGQVYTAHHNRLAPDYVFWQYPQKWERGSAPFNASAAFSCSKVKDYLTVDEVSDFVLISGLIRERWKQLQPHPQWAVIWCVYRAAYHTAMSLLLVYFIDKVWRPPQEGESEGMGEPLTSDGMTSGFRIAFCLDSADSVSCRMGLAVLGCIGVLVGTVVQSYTETWIIHDIKAGFSGKQLRDWIVTQLLWVDPGATSSGEYDHYAITDINFYYSSGSSTTEIDVRLDNLPTVAPSESNRLYRDANGFLKIT